MDSFSERIMLKGLLNESNLALNIAHFKKDNDEMKTSTSPGDPAATRFLSGAASLDDAIDQAFRNSPEMCAPSFVSGPPKTNPTNTASRFAFRR
jgi:hypothetical protein